MLAEIGHFSLLLVAVSSLLAALKSVFHFSGKQTESISMQLSVAHFCAIFSLISIFALAGAFIYDDFSLTYVASHSNSHLPVFFKGAAVWGGHEGSLLFWVVMLSCWSSAIALIRKKISVRYMNIALCASLLIVSAFAFFTLYASNPFDVGTVIPEEGRDLNPMLQDVGLIFHPPLLYVGYIGFASSFVLAIAALWNRENEEVWLLYARKFALFAWTFLSAGIVLGAWWAYNELGWGGWWFWDPVENASLLPWLTGTALLHSLVAGISQRVMLVWSLSLSFVTFSLSLLGTFVVRSGVLTSVHAFAIDPTRGIVLLLILLALVVTGFGSLLLRSHRISSVRIESVFSKSFLFLMGNLVFSVATITVMLGTFYPMIFQLFGLGNISVGAPYFNTLFAPLTFIALVLMAVAPWFSWKAEKQAGKKGKLLAGLAILSIVMGFACYRVQYTAIEFMPLVTWSLSLFVITTLLVQWIKAPDGCVRLKMLPMVLAHLGIVVMSIGSSMNAYHSTETTAKMSEGTTFPFHRFVLLFDQLELFIGPNYTSEKAHLGIYFTGTGTSIIQGQAPQNDANNMGTDTLVSQEIEGTVIPERRHYQVRVMNMTEPGIKTFWHGDLYITLGEKLKDGSFAVRIQYKAYVIWLWVGGLLVILGGVCSLFMKKRLSGKTKKDIEVTNV